MEDEKFLDEFMARARRREAKLANIGDTVSDRGREEEQEEVSYPPLSPLPEDPTQETIDYSSDLSLDCEVNATGNSDEIYRAEPVLCHEVIPESPPMLQEAPRTVLHEREVHEENIAPPESDGVERAIIELRRKVTYAEQAKIQLKKAVEVSKYGSKDHIESARLLQISDLKHLCYTNHLAMLEKGIRKKTDSLGSLVLSGIRLKITAKLRNDLAEDGVSHHFFCVALCGTEVKATEIIDTNDIRRQDLKAYLQFEEKLSFVDLPPEFVVKLEVFELVIGQQLPKLLSRLTPSKKSRITPESNFKRVGSLRLTLADRDANYKNLLQWSKHEESKYIERECKFEMKLAPEQLPYKAGMLHVRCLDSEGRPDWARFWVNLSEGQIIFWKSKQDALDEKKPNQILEFKDLCSETVQRLTPDDDLYRQNSFVLYTFQRVAGGEGDTLFQRVLKDDDKNKLVKHQLAAENKEDRDSWCALLDKSMNCFREWHGKMKIFSIEELKEIFSVSY